MIEPPRAGNFVGEQQVKVAVREQSSLLIEALDLHLVLFNFQLPFQDPLLDQAVDGFPKLFHSKRLREVLRCSEAHGCHCSLYGWVPGNNDDVAVGIDHLSGLQQTHAVKISNLDVGDNNSEVLTLDKIQGLQARRANRGRDVLGLENLINEAANGIVIVSD